MSFLKVGSNDQFLSPLSFRKNFVWSFVGNTIFNACQWGILVVLAKIGSPEIVGKFALGLAITAPIFMLSNMNLASIQATDINDAYSLDQYLGFRIVCSGFSLLAVVLILWLGGYSPDVCLIVLLVGFGKAVESMSDILYGLFQRHERLDLQACSLVIKGLLALIVTSITLVLTKKLVIALLFQAFVWAFRYLFFDKKNATRFKPVSYTFNYSVITSQFKLAFPLGIVAGLSSLAQQMPRIFLEKSYGAGELGLFAAISSFMTFGNMITMSMSRSAAPKLARYYSNNAFKSFKRFLKKLIVIGAGMGIVGIVGAELVGKLILRVAFGSQYSERNDVLIWTMAGTGLIMAATFLGTAATAARIIRPQAGIHAGKVAVAAISAIFFVPRFGLLGAAWTLIATYLYSSVAYLLLINRVFVNRH